MTDREKELREAARHTPEGQLLVSGVLTPELKAGVFAGVVACPQCGHEFEAEIGAPNL